MTGFWVYKITNLVNGKAYIGITEKSPRQRWNRHISECNRGKMNSMLYKAMRKYGINNFSIKVLYEATSRKEMMMTERGLIAAHGTFGNSGYNLTSGGEGPRDMIVTDEFRQMISRVHKGKVISAEVRKKMSDGQKMVYADDPEKRAMQSAKMKGKKRGEAEKLARSIAGKKDWAKRKQKEREAAAVADLLELEVANVLAV